MLTPKLGYAKGELASMPSPADVARVHSKWGEALYWRSFADGEDRFRSEAYEHITLGAH